MNVRNPILAAALAGTLMIPATGMADGLWHPANTEAGFTEHPDHMLRGKTRATVLAELARKDGTLALLQRGAPIPIPSAGPAKTRQQVRDELLGESAEQRRARMDLILGR